MPTQSTSTTGPQKRRRIDDESDSDDSGSTSTLATEAINQWTPPTIRSEIWFDDGSIVLQAENYQFRVHRSMLARHSSIFKDMFGMPQPSGEPTIEECPIVHLLDSAEDIKNMLIALYDKCYNSRDALPFKMLAGMIRMGRKYELDRLYKEGMTRLKLEFPAQLAEWEALPPYYTHIVEEQGLLFDIVGLALENNIRSILPTAYYLCISMPLNELLNGVKRADGVSVARLPPNVQNICVLGREKILLALSEYTYGWVDAIGDEEDCMKPAHCLKIAAILLKDIWVPMPEVARSLEKWTDFVSALPKVNELCAACLEDAKSFHADGRRRLWEKLPEFFDLPQWNELTTLEE